MNIRRSCALVLLACLAAGCAGAPPPYATTFGDLSQGSTMSVNAPGGDINVYPPKAGEAATHFTIESTAENAASPPPAPFIRKAENVIEVIAPAGLRSMLVRSPEGVRLRVSDGVGNVSVTNVNGPVSVHTDKGNVRVMVPTYATATAGTGNIDVTNGAADWPGTLEYRTDTGDVLLYVLETAQFHLRMHTDRGTLFDDFGLRGSASGLQETIDGDVNGGGNHAIDIEVRTGNIRVLRLSPQA